MLHLVQTDLIYPHFLKYRLNLWYLKYHLFGLNRLYQLLLMNLMYLMNLMNLKFLRFGLNLMYLLLLMNLLYLMIQKNQKNHLNQMYDLHH